MNIRYWLKGIRLYIAVGTALFTLETVWWVYVVYGNSDLAVIRVQEIYAWTAVVLLVMALLIGPALKLFPRLPGAGIFRDARRLLGVSAAWFSFLHAVITYVALFDAPNPFPLADTYQQSFLLGVSALFVLLLMAFTSFDNAFVRMGKWWFRLHRLIYAAALISLLHAFMIGSHATNLVVLVAIGVAAVGLALLHAVIIIKSRSPSKLQVITVTYMILFLVAVLNYGFTQYLGYNPVLGADEKHETHESHGSHE